MISLQRPTSSSVMAAAAQLGPLRGADGSAVFSTNGISVLGSVNGPLEVQRRDEIPDEAAIEVLVRPSAGVGGTMASIPINERHYNFSRRTRTALRIDYTESLPTDHTSRDASPNLDPGNATNYGSSR